MHRPEITPEYYQQGGKIALEVLRFLEQNHAIGAEEYPRDGITISLGRNDFRQFAERQNSKIKENLLRFDMDRSCTFSWRLHGVFYVVAYLSDDAVCNAVEGTIADRDVVVEEMSHALFKMSQYYAHGRHPNVAFVELIGATDKMNYQYLCNNAAAQNPENLQRMILRALAGLDRNILESEDPHYYFAHKWALQLIDFFACLGRQNADLVRKIHNLFYRGTDSDRMRILFVTIPEVAVLYSIPLHFEKAFDPENPLEKRLFQTIVQEIGDPKIIAR